MMRRILSLPFVVLLACILPVATHAQSWTGVLSTARAISWGNAGLPATLPDGETTANSFTPPTRTQCGSTIAAGASAATINSALAACTAGHYVLLGAGSFTITDTIITMYAQNGVTLRGSGAQSTIVTLAGTSQIAFSAANYGDGFCTTWGSGFTQGTTSITVSGCVGTTPVAGESLFLQQCDSGFSGVSTNPLTTGTGCATGSSYDNGALYICGNTTACQRAGEETGTPHAQAQAVFLTSVTNTGGGTYTMVFTPGLYMPNWGVTLNGQYSTPFVSWLQGANTITPYGNGLEDMTLYETGSPPIDIMVALSFTYASWVKGVRFVATASSGSPISIQFNFAKNCLISNNYIFNNTSITSDYEQNMVDNSDSDNLMINNITATSVMWLGNGSMEGDVFAYNYDRDAASTDINDFFEHSPGSAFLLYEGNQISSLQEDDTHGTHDLSTAFRNYISGWFSPYTSAINNSGITWNSGARFENAIGNSIGTSPYITIYQVPNGSGSGLYSNFAFNGAHTDTVNGPSSLRWGNWDNVTDAIRWCGNSSSPGWSTTCSSTSEIPTALSGAAAVFDNPVPSSMNLPCSFFLAGYTSTSCSAHPSGGTGLSWWKVCTAWTTFPTSCASSTTQPFPPVGPDVTGGPHNGGTAYDVPAEVAWRNLPIDTAYQNSYSITSSSWSSGTETITVSGVPSVEHFMGPFQISGGACATSGAGTSTGTEVFMTTSTVTTAQYALASNPGSCSGGTMLFPDVREFDERVYENDPSGGSGATQILPPATINATVQQN